MSARFLIVGSVLGLALSTKAAENNTFRAIAVPEVPEEYSGEDDTSPTPPVVSPLIPNQIGWGLTDVLTSLNQQIEASTGRVYTGGRGVLVRNPFDGFQDDTVKKVVPATFWSNDIYAPSQLYPGSGAGQGNPMCPNQGYDGWSPDKYDDCDADPNTGDSGPWNYAQMAYVVGSNMDQLMMNWDDIQNDDWGYGVFYPHDSNAADWRCRYIYGDGTAPWYDCPGGTIDFNTGKWTDDATKTGAGSYPAGNPYAEGAWGGGAGCHFQAWNNAIDQVDAYDSQGNNLVQDPDCQCNYAFKQDGWKSWVQTLLANPQPKAGFDYKFKDGSPSWGNDVSTCWMNNPRDMIMLQNELYWQRFDWSNQKIPQSQWQGAASAASNRPYWGWNEIPVSRESITNDQFWDAVLIKLPAALCPTPSDGTQDVLECLSDGAKVVLEKDIDQWVQAGYVVPGVAHVAERPGSYMGLVREWMDSSGNFQRYFFCQSWMSPNNKYKIVYEPISTSNPTGACYLDYA